LRYLFEDCALDTDRRELRRGGAIISVPPMVFDLLLYLIRNRERVVSKDDLISAIWEGRIVSDAAVTTRLNVARSAIGDSGEEQHLIKTLQRKGFRFVGAVREDHGHAGTPATSVPIKEPRPALSLPEKASIAVLPFTNMSADPGQDYITDGITEDIITELSRFSEMFVIARNSSFQYKSKSVDVRQVGHELGVHYVLEGSIRCDGDRIRITAQLVDAVTGGHRWAERYDRERTDIFAVQDEVARGIAGILAAHVNKAEIERSLLKPPATWQAYEFYMRAADALDTFFSSSFVVEELYEARRLLERSLIIDPNYARAHAAMSVTYTHAWINPLDGDFLNEKALEKANAYARKAVQLDRNLPQGHAQLGYVLAFMGEHEFSLTEFERASTLNPNFTDRRLACALIFAGEFEGAIKAAQAHMRADPFYFPISSAFLGLAFYMLKRYREALHPLRECISRAPNLRDGHVWLAATHAQMGQAKQADRQVAEVLRIEPTYKIDGTPKRIMVFKNPEDADHFFEGLRKAGLPTK
jgi:adenylate cyclase